MNAAAAARERAAEARRNQRIAERLAAATAAAQTRVAAEQAAAQPEAAEPEVDTATVRRCKLDPSLKAHPVSNFDTEKDITALSN